MRVAFVLQLPVELRNVDEIVRRREMNLQMAGHADAVNSYAMRKSRSTDQLELDLTGLVESIGQCGRRTDDRPTDSRTVTENPSDGSTNHRPTSRVTTENRSTDVPSDDGKPE